MWFVIYSTRYQRTGRELRHRTTITSVHLKLMPPIVVGGGGDVAVLYIVQSETFTLHHMKHSSLTSNHGFHSLTFTSSNSIQQRHWIYLVPTKLSSTYILFRRNITISSIQLRPSSTSRNFCAEISEWAPVHAHVSFLCEFIDWTVIDIWCNLQLID